MSQPQFYYTPDSAMWQISREQVLLLGGARTLLMQIAHPLVAEAVYQHSTVFDQPFQRLWRTLTLTYSMVFGTREEVEQSAQEIHRAHRPATGTLTNAVGDYAKGTAYNARNPKLGLWVYATLVEGALTTHQALIGDIPADVQQAFYEDTQITAELLGVTRNYLPETIEGLLDYMDTAIYDGTIVVGDSARAIAPHVLLRTRWYWKLISYPTYRLNVSLLPDPLRQQYGYSIGKWESKMVDGFCRLSKAIVPRLPSKLRYLPAYRRAMRLMNS